MTKQIDTTKKIKEKLFLYTSLSLVSGVLSIFVINIYAIICLGNKGPDFSTDLFASTIPLTLTLATIVGSVWLLASKQPIIKKLFAILYILLAIALVGFNILLLLSSAYASGYTLG